MESKSGIAGLACRSIFLNDSSCRMGTKSLRPKDKNRNFHSRAESFVFSIEQLSGPLELSVAFLWGWKLTPSLFSVVFADPLHPKEGIAGGMGAIPTFCESQPLPCACWRTSLSHSFPAQRESQSCSSPTRYSPEQWRWCCSSQTTSGEHPVRLQGTGEACPNPMSTSNL